MQQFALVRFAQTGRAGIEKRRSDNDNLYLWYYSDRIADDCYDHAYSDIFRI